MGNDVSSPTVKPTQTVISKTVMNWNVIQGHSWNDTIYNNAIAYITQKIIPSDYSKKQIERFKNALKWYTVIDNKLVIVDHNIPRWLTNNNIPLASYPGELPVVYTVIKKSDISSRLYSYMLDPVSSGYSRDSLYDKVIRDRLLGIGKRNVADFLKQSDIVQKMRGSFKNTVIKSYRPNFPMQHWQIDLIDMTRPDLVEKNLDYHWILVIVDIFSKFIYIYPLLNKEAKSVAAVINRIFLSGDIPKIIQNDGGLEFQGELVQILKSFNVRKFDNPGFSPQTNGFVENKNKQIKGMLHAYMSSRKTKQYYDILDRIAFNINSTKHAVTGFTPFQIHRGVDVQHTPLLILNEQINTINPYPVLNTQLGKRTPTSAKHITPLDDDISDNDSKVIRSHTLTQKLNHDRRVAHIKNVIHRVADKRERGRLHDEFSSKLIVGDNVRIVQHQQMNPGQKIVKIQLQNTDGVVVKEYGQNIIPKTVHFGKKLVALLYPDTFVVESIVRSGTGAPHYVLSSKELGSNVFVYQYYKPGVFVKRMFRAQLYLILDETREFIKPPVDGYKFVDPFKPRLRTDLSRPSILSSNVDNKTQLEIGVDGTTIVTKRLLKKNVMLLMKTFSNNDYIQSTIRKKDNKRIYIKHIFVINNELLQTWVGFLKEFVPKNSQSPKPFWVVDFSEVSKIPEDKGRHLNLEMSTYMVMSGENGWCFHDNDKMNLLVSTIPR